MAVAAGVGDTADAAPARIRFNIEPKRYSEALLDVAQQANVTLIGAGACEGYSRLSIKGSMSLEAALDTLLAGASCRWKLVAPGAVEIQPPPRAETPRPPPPTPVTVDELIVTATKRSRDPRQLAVAVTAIPRRQLEATAATDAHEASSQLAGVLATNLGPGRNKLLLRGLSDGAFTGRARSMVSTFLDDLPLNYNAPDPDLRLVDVERVEVSRGPQGALYGAGSMAGVYRIVTRRPDLTRWSAEARGTGAYTKAGDRSHAVEGFVNVPIWKDVAGLRVAAYDEVTGGYLDNIVLGVDNADRTERRGARISLMVSPAEDWSVELTGAGQHLRSADTHYTSPGLGLKRQVRIPEPHVNDIESLAGRIRHSWGWGELSSTTGFVRHRYGSLYDATATQNLYTDFARTSAYSERARTRLLVQDTVLTSRGASPIEWLAGVYAADAKVKSPTEFLAQNPRFPDGLVYGDTRRDHIREFAAYGEVSYAFLPRWTLAVGGRAFNVRSHTVSDVVSERYPPRTLDREANLTGFSPKLSLQYQFSSGDLLYGVVSQGYRAGGVNSGGALPLPANREVFAPDRLTNYEVGVKMEAWNRRLALTAAAFYDTWDDIQTDQFRPSGIPYTTNIGDARILGLEAEVKLRLAEGFTAQANGLVTRSRTSQVNLDFAPVLAERLPGAPAFSGGALLGYQRALPGGWVGGVIGEVSYVGRSRVTFDINTVPPMGGYLRAKLLAEVSRQNVGMQIYVTNPFDSFSDTFAFGNPFNPQLSRQITPQRPTTVGMVLFARY